jgi:hypothetical protein
VPPGARADTRERNGHPSGVGQPSLRSRPRSPSPSPSPSHDGEEEDVDPLDVVGAEDPDRLGALVVGSGSTVVSGAPDVDVGAGGVLAGSSSSTVAVGGAASVGSGSGSG